MFGPEDYLRWGELIGMTVEWMERLVLAHVYSEMSQDPTMAFDRDPAIAFDDIVEPELALMHAERVRANLDGLTEQQISQRSTLPSDKERLRYLSAMEERRLELSIFLNTFMAKLVLDCEPLLCSNSGVLLTAPHPLLTHMDRLDWCDPTWPLRKNSSFNGYFKSFDEGGFKGKDLDARFCFIDEFTGTIQIKNNSLEQYYRACHHELDRSHLEKLKRDIIEPFVGWSLVWSENSMPMTILEIIDHYGWIEQEWGVKPAISRVKETEAHSRKGRRPSGAKAEYYRRYPVRKPDGLSYEALSAELAEAGFPISARQIQNYERDRNSG